MDGPLLRVTEVRPLSGRTLEMTLTDGSTITRDVTALLTGPIFEMVKDDDSVFRKVRAEGGTVVWGTGADLCPDVLIWGGLPPAGGTATPADYMKLTTSNLRQDSQRVA